MKLLISKILGHFHVFITWFHEQVKEFIKLLPVKIYLVSLIILNLCSWFFAYYLVSQANKGIIILHYNVIFGVDLVGEAVGIYFFPFFSSLIILINSLLALCIFKKHRLSYRIFLAVTVVINVLSILALYSVYLINF